LKRSFAWGLDLTGSFTAAGGIGGLLQITDHTTGTRYLPTYDGNGNVGTLVNASTGVLGASYEYNAFGEPLRTTGTYAKTNPIRFSTKYTDNETGLIYYGFRYYDARNGRFINRDPIEERGGMNLYGFCGNDGVNQWDYLGQFSLGKMFKKIGNWIEKNWTSIVGAALMFVPGVGPALSMLWSAGVGYANGGIKGMAIGFAASALGSTIGNPLAGRFADMANITNRFALAAMHGYVVGGLSGAATALASGGDVASGFRAGALTGAVLAVGSDAYRYSTGKSPLYSPIDKSEIAQKYNRDVAKLIEGTYDPNYKGFGDWVKDGDTVFSKNGMQRAVYNNAQTGKAVMVFAGTVGPLWGPDWRANILQAIGLESSQYESGINDGVDMFNSYAARGVVLDFAGHSLGGGIASAVATITGGHAMTINAAGVASATLRGVSRSSGSVTAFYSSFDVLRYVNAVNPVTGPAMGNQVSLGAAGIHFIAPAAKAFGP
jgi:RHS repeat-associated protein